MKAMRLALAMGRLDVDQMLSEIDHEQFCEWSDYLTLEPHGWQGQRIVTSRLSYLIAQVQTPKKLRERDFEIKIGANVHTPAIENARFEAMSVRLEIQEQYMEAQIYG